jgi:hypothetical protein
MCLLHFTISSYNFIKSFIHWTLCIDLFVSATRQQKLRLPSLRVDNSTSEKITHYCFGANSGKKARSLLDNKMDISFYFCEKPASLRQREVKIDTPSSTEFSSHWAPPPHPPPTVFIIKRPLHPT